MYEIVNATPKEIVMVYLVFMGACLVTYPAIRLIYRGVTRWKSGV